MTREEILEGLYEIKNWKCNGDAKTHEVVAEAIKALEQEPRNLKELSPVTPQEPILDKIRAEILRISSYKGYELGGVKDGYRIAIVNVLNIIDKYKAESEGK